MSQPHFRTCNLCEAMCGVAITTGLDLDGETPVVTSIKGDDADPFSRGHVCAKTIGLKSLHEDPDRLRYPLKRVGGEWQEISWDQAFDEVEQGIRRVQREHGRHAMAFYAGNPTVHNLGATLFAAPLMASLHSRNKFSATSVDQLPHMLAALQMFGHQLMLPIPDIDNTDFMLMLGANPAASNGSLMSAGDPMGRLKKITERGGRLIVLDPRRTETAKCFEHQFIRPAGDVYFLAAFLNVLFADNVVSLGELKGRVTGLEVLKAAVAPFEPEDVEAATGISADWIRRTAHEFAAAERAVCYGRMGVCTQPWGGVSAWLVNAINVVTGNVDAPGGAMFTHPAVDLVGLTSSSPALRGSFNRYRSRVRGLPEFNGELPVAVMAEEMLTPGQGQIRGLITHAGNPVLSTPNGRQLEEALGGLDFMVSIDFYLNETTRHAHIILPPTGPLEHGHYDLLFNTIAVRNVAKYSPALMEPAENTRHDWQILLELSARLNANTPMEKAIWKRVKQVVERLNGPEGILDLMLQSGPYGHRAGNALHGVSSTLLQLLEKLPPARKLARQFRQLQLATPASGKAIGLSVAMLKDNPHGLDLGPLEPGLRQRICTPDGKVLLAPHIYLPELERARQEMPQGGKPKKGEMLLIGRRHIRSNNSWLHNSLPLVKGKNRCTVMVNPADAAALKVQEGEDLRVTSRVGDIVIPVELCEDIMPGVISIPHGFGHHREGTQLSIAEGRAGVSMNDITDEQWLDSLSGTAALNGIPVKVSLANPPAKAKRVRKVKVEPV
ncbi:MAG TPA: molybdopterin oxidoreductase family protein [Fluviicoccus sp.]|nr:molybdopterin oxidoreductase family protein [Fluviicoccus sp.]